MKVTVYWYALVDANHDRMVDVCSDPSDWISVGGVDKSGKYQQFDSTEAYHLQEWANRYGFFVVSGKVEIDLPI